MAGYETIKPLAKVIMILLGVIIVVDLISIVFSFSQIGLLERAAEGIYDEAEANANDQRIGGVTAAYFLLFVVTGVVFVTWMGKAHRNLGAFGTRSGFTSGQVKWAFFIPFINLVRPYRVMKAIWQGSVPVDDKLVAGSTQVLGAWWGTWIFGELVGRAAGTFGKAKDIPGLVSATNMSIVSSFINVACAALAIWLVSTITARQESCASGQVASEFD
jgi:hypothetical protein